MNLQNFFYRKSCKMQQYGDTTKERKWLYVDYEKILKKLIEIYAEQEKVNVKVKIERSDTNEKNR